MLLIYRYSLTIPDQELLLRIDSRVQYWVRSWVGSGLYNHAVPIDWWISFSSSSHGLIWVMQRGEYSEIVYSE